MKEFHALPTYFTSTLYRITELLSGIKHKYRELFYYMPFTVVDQLFPEKKAWFFLDKVDMGRGGVGVGVEVRNSV